MRILVVDDTAVIRELLSTMLSDHEVVVAESRSQARLMSAAGFDLILVDRWINGDTGFDVLADVRAAGYTGHVVLVSGGVLVSEIAEMLRAGFRAVLHKPFDVVELRSLLASLD